MPSQPRYIFVNLPVKDVSASIEYFGKLGFEFDQKFTDETCACMVVREQASYVMLLDESKFTDFTPHQVAGRDTTEVLVCLSAESRDEVDSFADTAIAAGGTTAREPQDYGFMYGRSFHDPDGHIWEIMWMDPKAVEQGPKEYAGQAA